ncbi:DUF4262 domain-containing protein [Streptomyces sp. NPDC057638]|uniref:DUF4262 domain-containing protein n=1 Tax=Streptomyces sp. NPDC057638 TaxID=3346190 RepID=UPI00369BEF49
MLRDGCTCRCVICHDYGDRDAADPMDRRTVEQIQEHGWSVVMVPADDEGPAFAYTIGLWHTHTVPELALFGLDIHTMHHQLNTLGHAAVGGAVLDSGTEHPGIVPEYPVVLKTADLRWYRQYFGRAIAFYRRPPFPVLQVVWPNPAGRFLWQPGIGERYQQSQPHLWLKPVEHPQGPWAPPATG